MKNSCNGDFSTQVVARAVLRMTLLHPAVIYPLAVFFLAAFALFLFGTATWLVVTTLTATAGAGGAWLFNLVYRRDRFARRYVDLRFARIEQRRQRRIEELKVTLGSSGNVEGQKHFTRISEKYTVFKEVIDSKLDPDELSYTRYLGAAEQVYLGVLDNLHEIADISVSMKSIDSGSVSKKLQERLTTLLEQNEHAMRKLDEFLSQVALTKTQQGRVSADLEAALSDLSSLASQVQ